LHGGATPSGDAWHKPHAAIDAAKTERKIRDRVRAAKRRAARLAAMSEEERAAHERWQRSHAPTSAADRAARRAERKHAKAARDSWERRRTGAELSPEVRELDDTIAALRARYAALRAEMEGAEATTPEWFREGVFG
jgi:chromosome segregation ATPase